MDDKRTPKRGVAKRRKVLGNDWVDRANAKKTPFNARNSRISSPAPPGARSGRGRISTSARGASW